MTDIDTHSAIAALYLFKAINAVRDAHGAPAQRALVTFLNSFPSEAHISWGNETWMWMSIKAAILGELLSESLDEEDGVW
jgi:phage gp16-like protein